MCALRRENRVGSIQSPVPQPRACISSGRASKNCLAQSSSGRCGCDLQANPKAKPQWLCGLYPGSRSGEQRGGTEADFAKARAAFGVAWRIYSASRAEADYQTWRDQRDWTTRKYAMRDRGEQVSLR